MKNLPKEKILASTSNYFQNLGKAKDIFKYGLTIKFEEYLNSAKGYDLLKEIFTFRHRIVHVDPLLTMLNELNIKDNPKFSTNQVMPALDLFDSFINNLHGATLKLKNVKNR